MSRAAESLARTVANKKRPLALDMFCGAGGVSVGLHRAGFDVVGVDIAPQPNYRGGTFIQGDALTFDLELENFALVWASPPCQAFTAYKRRRNHVKPCADLIAETRARLVGSGTPYVIENVDGSTLNANAMLCGSMFGLDVRRHRFFESSHPFDTPTCNHGWQQPRFTPASNRTNLRRTVEVGVWRIPLPVQRRAMGIDWMTLEELSQAIPPAYAEYIGRQFIALFQDQERRAKEAAEGK